MLSEDLYGDLIEGVQVDTLEHAAINLIHDWIVLVDARGIDPIGTDWEGVWDAAIRELLDGADVRQIQYWWKQAGSPSEILPYMASTDIYDVMTSLTEEVANRFMPDFDEVLAEHDEDKAQSPVG